MLTNAYQKSWSVHAQIRMEIQCPAMTSQVYRLQVGNLSLCLYGDGGLFFFIFLFYSQFRDDNKAMPIFADHLNREIMI